MSFSAEEPVGEIRPFLAPLALDGVVISGKYGPGHQRVYDVRQAFLDAGIEIAFPRGDEPIETYSGYTFSSKEEQYIPFQDMQRLFFVAIERNPYHVVVPGKTQPGYYDDGYIGFSTAHELCWAMYHAKPVVTTGAIGEISKFVPQNLFDIIQSRKQEFIPVNPLELSTEGLKQALQALPEAVNYGLTEDERHAAFAGFCKLLRIESHRWLSWTQRTERDYVSGLRPNWINERISYLYTDPAAYVPWEELMVDTDALAYIGKQYRDLGDLDAMRVKQSSVASTPDK